MIDDVMEDNEVKDFGDLIGLDCENTELLEDFSKVVLGQVENVFSGVNLVWESVYGRDLASVFESVTTLQDNNKQLFTILSDRMGGVLVCNLINRLNLDELKKEVDEALGEPLEDVLDYIKTVYDEMDMEEVDINENMSFEDVEDLVENHLFASETLIKSVSEKINPLLVKFVDGMSDESFVVSEELKEEIKNVGIEDYDFEFKQWFTKIIEVIYSDIAENSKDYKIRFLVEQEKELEKFLKEELLLVETEEDILDLLAKYDKIVNEKVLVNLARLKVFIEEDEELTFDEFIVSYKFIILDIKKFFEEVFSNLTLITFRLLDIQMRKDLELAKFWYVDFIEDEIERLGYEDKGSNEDSNKIQHVLFNKTSFSYHTVMNYRIRERREYLDTYDSNGNREYILKFSAYTFFSLRRWRTSYNQAKKLGVQITKKEQFFNDMKNEENGLTLKSFRKSFCDKKIKPIFVKYMNEDNYNKFEDLILDNLFDEEVFIRKGKIYEVEGRFFKGGDSLTFQNLFWVKYPYQVWDNEGYKTIPLKEFDTPEEADGYGVSCMEGSNNFIYKGYEAYLNILDGTDALYEEKYDSGKSYAENQANYEMCYSDFLSSVAWSKYKDNESYEGIDYYDVVPHFSEKDLFFKIYDDDGYETLKDIIDDDKSLNDYKEAYFKEVVDYFKGIVTDVENYIEEVFDIVDDALEEVGEVLYNSYSWLRELIKKGY